MPDPAPKLTLDKGAPAPAPKPRGPSLLVLLPPLVFALLAALFWVGMWREDPNALPSMRVGQAAPALRLQPFGDAPPPTDADLRAGEVRLVNFWASWCGPCRAEHPQLEALAAEGVTILGVNYKDAPQNARAFLAELGNPYAAIGADPEARTGFDWGVYGIPETFVIDGEGRVLLRFAGPLTPATVAERLRPVMERASP